MHTPSRWKKITVFAVTGMLVLATGTGTLNALRPLPTAAAKLNTMPTSTANTINFAWPTQGAAAAGILGFGVLGTNTDQTPRPTASMAKAITSLAVLEKSPLKAGEQGPVYTVTASDVARYDYYYSIGGSVARVSAGEQLTQYQALQAVMLPSANNVADSLVAWVFGSHEAYQAYATDMVQRLGMTHTTIGSDASGMSASTLSTPSDLILLGEAVMSNPVLKDIVSQETAVIPVAGTITNVDWLLGQEGIVGIKTGNTDEAGGCFLGASTKTLEDGSEAIVITAIMGAPTRNNAMSNTLPLMRSIKAQLAHETFIKAGDVLGSYTTPWGTTATIAAKSNVSITRWRGYDLKFSLDAQTIQAPLTKGARIGTATVSSGGKQTKTDLVLTQDVASPSLWWRATRH